MTRVVRPFAQLVSVTVLAGLALLASDFANFRSGWNLLWMLAIPFGVARAFDRDEGTWPLIGLYLLIAEFVAMALIAAAFGVGV